MTGAHSRARFAVTLGLLLCPCALALNPALDVSQYAHTSWKNRDGFTKGIIYDVSQTPDGFLWLATEFGLVRFDGVKPVPWEPPRNQSLPSNNVRRLFAARDGTLWISTINGLASWKNGTLTQYPELSGFAVGRAFQDREGSIWAAARGTAFGKLCQIRNDNAKCSGENVLGPFASRVYEDGKGNLCVGTGNGVWRWKPGPPEFYLLSKERAFVPDVAEDLDGALLITTQGGLGRLIDGKMQMAYPYPARLRGLDARILRDRDGGLWAGTFAGGIVHFHQGRTDVFSQSDGLTGDNVLGSFEDKEGNIWVATANGLDRFRETPIVTFTIRQGLSNSPDTAVLAARDGGIWFDTVDGRLNRLDRAGVTVYASHIASPKNTRVIRTNGLPDHRTALFEDSGGRIWISSVSGVGYLENDTYIPTTAPGGAIYALTEDNNGDLWIANPELGLLRLSRGNVVQRVPWETFGRQGPGMIFATHVSLGGVWVGFENGGIAWFRDGRVQASYSAADGLAKGHVNDLRFDHAGALWIGTDSGLSLLKNGRLSTITKENDLPCDGVHWTMPGDFGSVWLMMPCGLARAKLSDLESWSTGRRIQTTVFGSSDGVSLRALAGVLQPNVGKSPDGRLWFWNGDGIGVVDPRRLPFNKIPPPVHVEQLIADRKTYAAGEKWRLPPVTRDLEIDYTALSFVAPEKNRFRYKLEGHDRDWVDAGTRRQAFYNDLPPRNYRFRVMASNNDGVWNEAGASFNFSIAPAYYQTTWFRAVVVAAFLTVLWGLYRYRLRQVAKEFNARMEGRVSERMRVARDLHDTLLQSFQGVLLKFSTIKYVMRSRPDEAEETLERIIDQARAAITEGRDAVQGLRASTTVANDLVRAITTFGEGFTADHAGPNCPEFRVYVEGKSRDLPPLIRDEAYKIACECLRNAFRHAHAKRIEVQICYDPRQFRLQLVDNGKGIDPAVLSAGGRTGHHGLPGIHERAELAGGKLSAYSQLNSGTKIELAIPGSIAYTKSPPDHRPVTSGNGEG
jgi:signal transduction histidine kinase/ligand-binding sensor domain-containing protein